MSKPLNLRDFEPGARVRLQDGTVLLVVDNPGDGAWLICAPEDSPEDRDAVFLADIIGEAD